LYMRPPIPRWLFPTALFLTSALGCGGRDFPRPEAAGGDLTGRLTAAKEMHGVAEQDKALACVARDAGDAGDAVIADHALAAMHDVAEKNKAAYSASLRLAKAGKAAAAAATANAIHDVALRDKALAKIAKGDTSE
jgi:hypothetical protein